MHCYGRLTNADLPSTAIHPILLPKDNHFTTLVISDIHQRHLHVGVSHMLARVCLRYWIPHGRARVQTVFHRCLVCKRHKGAPFALPQMPALPRERVARADPFCHTGLDYLGPLYVRDSNNDASQLKVWICLLRVSQFTQFTWSVYWI